MKILVSGGAGFIGSAVCRNLINESDHHVVNLDKLTYAANLNSLTSIADNPRYTFVQLDVCNQQGVLDVMTSQGVDAVMHLAAESHVDRSISGPSDFIQTNIVGTYAMLEASRAYWQSLDDKKKAQFRFHHVSTDEVYGDLPLDESLFTEETAYDPSSPYSASKAASDHLVRAWNRTYGLPVVLTNCSNNYGPCHFPEKLIPLIILNSLDEKPLPVYGKGENVRDWLYVDDHARALERVITKGTPGETYNIGGNSEQTNIGVVREICRILDKLRPRSNGARYDELITFVEDRPGHDLRYAIDANKIKDTLGWTPEESFASGLEKTIIWYLENENWWRPLREQKYDGARLGLVKSAG